MFFLLLTAAIASLGVDLVDHVIAMRKWRELWPTR